MDPTQQPIAPQQPQQAQQYQPYQPYPTGAPAQQPPPVSRPWHNAKIALHAISIVFCIILIGISIALAVNPRVLSLQVVWIAPEAAAAIIWSVAELITVCVRKGQHRGIHPGAHVGLHLIFWLAFLVGAGLTAYIVAVYVEEQTYYSSYRYNRYASLSFYLRSLQAELAFLILLLIIHFTLFVRACVESARRNRTAQQPVFVPVNAYYASYPMQQQQAQQPVYPMQQPQQAHLSANYGQPKEVQPQYTGSTQPSVPAQTHDDGVQHVGHAH
ncbi:hypothetical protein PG985_014384 [Apiospora marii]|uniref:uncharacterized protein n=1 Tax=Apiospora marii TaxID=335849 RepID=UPI003132140B